jgi:hypothetical protein
MPNLNIVFGVDDDHSVSHKNSPNLFGLLKMAWRMVATILYTGY